VLADNKRKQTLRGLAEQPGQILYIVTISHVDDDSGAGVGVG
jgi:hypothetical protein